MRPGGSAGTAMLTPPRHRWSTSQPSQRRSPRHPVGSPTSAVVPLPEIATEVPNALAWPGAGTELFGCPRCPAEGGHDAVFGVALRWDHRPARSNRCWRAPQKCRTPLELAGRANGTADHEGPP